jgi:hypothetical protein
MNNELQNWIDFRKQCEFCKSTHGYKDLCTFNGEFHGDCVMENCEPWRDKNDV